MDGEDSQISVMNLCVVVAFQSNWKYFEKVSVQLKMSPDTTTAAFVASRCQTGVGKSCSMLGNTALADPYDITLRNFR